MGGGGCCMHEGMFVHSVAAVFLKKCWYRVCQRKNMLFVLRIILKKYAWLGQWIHLAF